MTKSFEHFDSDLCDKLFDFIYPDESSMSDKEVEAELQRLKIDIRPAWDKVQMALSQSQDAAEAKKHLEYAKKKRPYTLAKLKSIKLPSFPSVREEIQRRIEDHFTGPEKAAYCRRLEGASDEDIKTLIEDLFLLEEFSKDSNDVEA